MHMLCNVQADFTLPFFMLQSYGGFWWWTIAKNR